MVNQFIARAEFATGATYTIERNAGKGGKYLVVNGKTGLVERHCHTVLAAWAAIAYMAGINHKTYHTSGVQWAPDSDMQRMLPRRAA